MACYQPVYTTDVIECDEWYCGASLKCLKDDDICKKILDNPKTLSCQHSFCFQCLDNEFCEDSKLFCYIIILKA